MSKDMLASSSQNTGSPRRFLELDLAKGFLVLIMVAYHAASIAVVNYPEVIVFIQATSFLHYVFVFLTGYICGWHYMPKFSENPLNTRRRIRRRAFKLFAILLVSNLLLYIIGVFEVSLLVAEYQNYKAVINTLVIGISGSLFGFEILYYLSLFLFFASFFLGKKIGVLRIAIVICLVALSPFSSVAFCLAFGGIGIFMGYWSAMGLLNKMWELAERNWMLIVLALLLDIVFRAQIVDLIHVFPYWKISLFAIECALWLMSLVLITVRIASPSLNAIISKLGEYTLFLYMGQMFVLRLGYMLLKKAEIGGYLYYGLNLIFGICVVIIIAFLTGFLREKSYKLNVLYKAVFV